MRRSDEVIHPFSCFNRAREDELVFVLLGRDVAAPAAIRAWVKERIKYGKNQPEDLQIIEALSTAGKMEREQERELEPPELPPLPPRITAPPPAEPEPPEPESPTLTSSVFPGNTRLSRHETVWVGDIKHDPS